MSPPSLMSTSAHGSGQLPRRLVQDGQFLQPADPAIYAITDFTREYPITVEEDRQIDSALDDMIRFAVRALLVLREGRIVGLVTSYDIQGERPLQFLQSSNYTRHQDVRVGHVMTPWAELSAVDWREIEILTVGELLKMLQGAGLSHVILLEEGRGGAPIVRGMVSRARLERQIRRLGAGPVVLSLKPNDGGDARQGHQERAAQMHGDRP